MKYKLFIDKYSIMENDYKLYEEVVEVKDKLELYQIIGYIYSNSLEKINDIRFFEI